MSDEVIAWIADSIAGRPSVSMDFSLQQSWPEGIFDQATALTHLELHMDALTSLPEDFFDRLPNLTHLELHADALPSLPDGFINRLSDLEEWTVTGEHIAPEGVLRLQVELERSGPYSISAKVREGAPFAITVNLVSVGGSMSLSHEVGERCKPSQ